MTWNDLVNVLMAFSLFLSLIFFIIYGLLENGEIFKIFAIKSLFAIAFLFSLKQVPFSHNTNYYYLQYEWERNGLPTMDSTMIFVSNELGRMIFRSTSRSPVRHDSKTITYDLWDDYSYEDIFVNESTQQRVYVRYVTPTILRKADTSFCVFDEDKEETITLNYQECLQLLSSWGLDSVTKVPHYKKNFSAF